MEACGALVENDFVRGIVRQFELEVRAGIATIHEMEAMRPLTLASFEDSTSALSLTIDDKPATVNGYIRTIRRKYWTALFQIPNLPACLPPTCSKSMSAGSMAPTATLTNQWDLQ